VTGEVTGQAPTRRQRARDDKPRRGALLVKVSDSEHEQLRARAGELGLSMGRLLVDSALSDSPPADQQSRGELVLELRENRRLLATIANNVNQLARLSNISGDVPAREELERTRAEVVDIVARLRVLTEAQR
jgi:Bacterial mobilisation protein (MobC)